MKRNRFAVIAGMLVLAASLPAADANSPADPPQDRRPFGKYLVKVCELGRGCYDPSDSKKAVDPTNPTTKPKAPKVKQPKPSVQTITLAQVACPGNVIPCNVQQPEYPLQIGQPFYIQATADSKLDVTLEVKGHTALAGKMVQGTQPYVVTGDGAITIKATQPGDTNYLAAPPTSIVLQTADSPSPSCYGLYKAAVVTPVQPDITAIAALAGNPVPFVLATQGPGTILVYATRWPIDQSKGEQTILDNVEATLNGPLGNDATKSFGIKPPAATPVPFLQELPIAHAAALGDPAARITALGYSKFTVQNIGSTPGKVRITASDTPKCEDWKTFLTSIRGLEWSLESEPSTNKLWYLSADDAAKAMNAVFPPATSGSGSPASTSGSPATSPASGTPAAATSNATISVTQPPGSKVEIKTDTTPCVEAGLEFGNSSACAPASSSSTPAAGASGAAAPSGTNPVSPPKPISTASIGIPTSTPAAGQIPQSPTDMLVYGNPTPGDDAQIAERNRILALLDLPRPEMIINAWVIQNSTTDPRAMGKFSDQIRKLVERYNDSLEKLVLEAYTTVSFQMRKRGYFNGAFYHYVSDRFVAEGSGEATTAQDFLGSSPARLAETDEYRTGHLGICAPDRYCLGYSWLFNSTKPRLTDLLLGLIAADKPFEKAMDTIKSVQGTAVDCCCLEPAAKSGGLVRPAYALGAAAKDCQIEKEKEEEIEIRENAIEKGRQTEINKEIAKIDRELKKSGASGATGDTHCGKCARPDADKTPDDGIPAFHCEALQKSEDRNRCITIQQRLNLHEVDHYLDPKDDCTAADEWETLRSQFTALRTQLSPVPDWHPRFHLACFARAAQAYLKSAGLARAAVADFLFQYKRSQQYPHEFSPYGLNHAASNLNSVLSPMIEAFNRDVVAFQTYMRTDIEYEIEVANAANDRRCCVKRLFGLDKPSFFNDGIVSVRTISGQSAQVSATSQSFLDASKAPSLSDLASAMGGSATASGTSPLAGVLGAAATQAPVSLLTNILASYQKTYAQIGRTLQLQAVPRSLSTASAAEISVYMKAGDPANSPVYSGGPPSAQQQNTSEVSDYEVTTRIRIESVKLFELSSYSAVLQRSRSKFPLLPPFVEIPYLGTLAGIPIPAAKEYHASTAIISAMVVPTAADIGFGLPFFDDLVLYGPAGKCVFRAEESPETPEPSADGSKPPPVCEVRRALSTSDLHASVTTFNDAMVLCLADESSAEAASKNGAGTAGQSSDKAAVPAPAIMPGRENFVLFDKNGAATAQGNKNRPSCKDFTFKQLPQYETSVKNTAGSKR
jgi:hypothetical protein